MGGYGVAAMAGRVGVGKAAVAGESRDQRGELLGGRRREDSDGSAVDAVADQAWVCGEDLVARV